MENVALLSKELLYCGRNSVIIALSITEDDIAPSERRGGVGLKCHWCTIHKQLLRIIFQKGFSAWLRVAGETRRL